MNLFDRLPPDLFRALTGRNHRLAWELLTRLFDRFFGPDAIPPHPDGYLQGDVIREVERFLTEVQWQREDDDPIATPLASQAGRICRRLVETGWLVEEKIGMRTFVGMRPVVMRFLETLHQFAVEGPQLIGGRVQMIHNQLKSVMEDPTGQAAGFQTAAQECARLINTLNSTTFRVRDLMKELTREGVTATFVRRFFGDYISDFYVRDFRQLRTENHPLRLRWEILAYVNELSRDERLRGLLLQGYAALPRSRSGEEPLQLLERDVERFHRLLDVERFLERLDRAAESAMQRAVAYLGYKLKVSERIEEVIQDTIRAVVASDQAGVPIEGSFLVAGTLMSEDRLRTPYTPPEKPVRQPLKRRQMTVHERAEVMLRKAMVSNRDTSLHALRSYARTSLVVGETKKASDLRIETVSDAVVYLVFSRLAALASTPGRTTAQALGPLFRNLGIDVQAVNGSRADTAFMNTPAFTITRRS